MCCTQNRIIGIWINESMIDIFQSGNNVSISLVSFIALHTNSRKLISNISCIFYRICLPLFRYIVSTSFHGI